MQESLTTSPSHHLELTVKNKHFPGKITVFMVADNIPRHSIMYDIVSASYKNVREAGMQLFSYSALRSFKANHSSLQGVIRSGTCPLLSLYDIFTSTYAVSSTRPKVSGLCSYRMVELTKAWNFGLTVVISFHVLLSNNTAELILTYNV